MCVCVCVFVCVCIYVFVCVCVCVFVCVCVLRGMLFYGVLYSFNFLDCMCAFE